MSVLYFTAYTSTRYIYADYYIVYTFAIVTNINTGGALCSQDRGRQGSCMEHWRLHASTPSIA